MKRCFLFAGKLVTWGPFRLLECLVKQFLFNMALNESVIFTSSFLFIQVLLFFHQLDAVYGTCVASVLSSKC